MKKVLTTMAIMAVSMMMCHRAVGQDLTKETPEEFFKFKYDKNSGARITGFKKRDDGIYVIPDKVEKKGEYYPVTAIDERVAEKNDQIRFLVIPESMKSIGYNTFSYLPNLEKIVFKNKGKLGLSTYVFCDCPKLREVEVLGTGDVVLSRKMKDYNFRKHSVKRLYVNGSVAGDWLAAFKGAEELVLGPNVKTVFHRGLPSDRLKKLTVMSKVISWPKDYAKYATGGSDYFPWFEYSKVREVEFSPELVKIDYEAFAWCENLKTLDLRNTKLKVIGEGAFKFCLGLENLYLPETLEEIQSEAFQGCIGLKEVYIPDNCKKIRVHAFEGCNNLEKASVKKGTVIEFEGFGRKKSRGLVTVVERENGQEQAYSDGKNIHRREVTAEALQAFAEGVSNIIDRSSASSSSTSSGKTTVDGNKVVVPEIVEVKKGTHGRIIDNDNDYNDEDYYFFKGESSSIKVHHRYRKNVAFSADQNYYYPDKNKEFIKYATGEDAARAGWVYRNEGALRTIGQKKK